MPGEGEQKQPGEPRLVRNSDITRRLTSCFTSDDGHPFQDGLADLDLETLSRAQLQSHRRALHERTEQGVGRGRPDDRDVLGDELVAIRIHDLRRNSR